MDLGNVSDFDFRDCGELRQFTVKVQVCAGVEIVCRKVREGIAKRAKNESS